MIFTGVTDGWGPSQLTQNPQSVDFQVLFSPGVQVIKSRVMEKDNIESTLTYGGKGQSLANFAVLLLVMDFLRRTLL